MKKGTLLHHFLQRLALLLAALLLFGGAFSLYHHAALAAEAARLQPLGTLYPVNGHSLHVYTEGPVHSPATIVMLSGSGTAAPIYDFKILYTKLSPVYRVAVVERSGYGYSPTSGAPRDLDTVLEESRALLAAAGETGPYVLMPHSISGLEALYWAQKYPQEVAAIVGLDMSVPQAEIPSVPFTGALLACAQFLGAQRLPFLYPIEYVGLTEKELQQARYLTYRNAFNRDIAAEMAQTPASLAAIDLDTVAQLPILDFVSFDKQSQKEHAVFAQSVHNLQMVQLEAGHYLHQTKSEAISEQTLIFLGRLNLSGGTAAFPPHA